MSKQPDESENRNRCAESDADADEAALLSGFGESRRRFFGQVTTATAAVVAAQLLAEQRISAQTQTISSAQANRAAQNTVPVKLKINGAANTQPILLRCGKPVQQARTRFKLRRHRGR